MWSKLFIFIGIIFILSFTGNKPQVKLKKENNFHIYSDSSKVYFDKLNIINLKLESNIRKLDTSIEKNDKLLTSLKVKNPIFQIEYVTNNNNSLLLVEKKRIWIIK